MPKYIYLLIFITTIMFACESDCTKCHIKLDLKMNEHQSLNNCKTCHTKENLSNINMGDAACGADCFQCHNIKKLVETDKEHKVLNTCMNCHNINGSNVFVDLNKKGTLKDFVKGF